MAINIKFDLAGNPEPPTINLATRSGSILGQLDVNVESIDLSDKFNDSSEFSFTLNKYVDGELTNLWDKVVDFKLVYCKEWDMWFEITVELDEETETIKTVFCTQLGQAELSQIKLYNIHINEEGDSNWNTNNETYKSTILYDENNQDVSLLHRLLKDKAPHYSILHVDDTIKNIQRSFSFDDTSIYDAFMDIAEEIGCLFVFHSNSGENRKIQRTISVYDLWQNCKDCGHRGEFTDVCPKCGSKNIKYGYGEDTLIFVTSDELASNGIQLTTDTDSVKNCFKLEAGDDLMTATVRNCNPNGTDYIWRFSEDMKSDMSKELVDKIESYDSLYKDYYDNHESKLNENLVNQYNDLVENYKEYYNTKSTCLNCGNEEVFDGNCPKCGSNNILSGKNLQTIPTTMVGYSSLMNAYYNTIDLALYLESALMPSIEMSKTTAKEQANLLTSSSISTVAVNTKNIESISKETADSAVLSMAKIIVKSTYKVEVNNSSYNKTTHTWSGNFIVTNYSDEKDTAESQTISVTVNNDSETFIRQKIEKSLNKEDTDDYSISGLFEEDYDSFCAELKEYALNPLKSFYDACDACLNILIDSDAGDKNKNPDLYNKLYVPYYKKSSAITSEIKIRENEIAIIKGVWDKANEENPTLVTKGLQQYIEECRNEIQNTLNFEKYLGTELWFEFCSYRRDDKYSNDNYISDGLNNAELFKKALEFIEVAENEIYKASELQHSISTSLNNLLAIDKFKPFVKSFKNGNWIRVQVDDRIYKLRLLEYGIDYGNFDNIPVEFSDVTKIKNGITDVKEVLSQASSMASSYSSVQRQADQSKSVKETVDKWVSNGLNTALVQIQSNNNEEIAMTENGLLCRSFDDIAGEYSPEQYQLTHNIMAFTNDNWNTVKQAIGKHDYKYFNSNNELVDATGYGMSADFVTAGIVTGSQIIGGDIYSSNYPKTDGKSTGSHLNLLDGTFSFAGGKLTYDGDHLAIDGEITVATSGTIGCWNVNNLSIYKGSETWGNSNGMYFGTEGLSLGNTFTVTEGGQLYAANAEIEGAITATSFKTKTDGFTVTVSNGISITDKNEDIDVSFYIKDDLGNWSALYSTGLGSRYGGLTFNPSWAYINNNLEVENGIRTGTYLAVGSRIYLPNNYSLRGLRNGYEFDSSSALDNSITMAYVSTDDKVIIGQSDNPYGTEIRSPNSIMLKCNGTTANDDNRYAVHFLRVNFGTESEPVYYGCLRSRLDNYTVLGSSSYRFRNVYSTNGVSTTSDRNQKHDINKLDEKYIQLFDLLEPVTYVLNTGERTHTGFISQDVENAIEQLGMTSMDFGGFCKDMIADDDGKPILDENGNEQYHYSLRYKEFIALNTAKIKQLEQLVLQLQNEIKELKS